MTPWRVEGWIAGRPFAVTIEAHSASDAEAVALLLWPEVVRIVATTPVHVAVQA